jgi:flagellar FliL protein
MAAKTPPAAQDGDDSEAQPTVAAKKTSLKKILIFAVAAIALVAAGVASGIAASHWLTRSAPAAKKPQGPGKAEAAESTDAQAEADGAEADAAADPEAAKNDAAATYLDFDQPFVVNVADEGQVRYLQVTVAVMSHDPKMAEEVKRHMPLIRNNLVMLFSSQTRDTVMTREGKEKIRAEAQAEVQKILKEQVGRPVIESLYFTSFVMQ